MTSTTDRTTNPPPALVWPDGRAQADAGIRYTIATLVTDPVQYEAMRASFRAGGFDGTSCEYIMIDNTGPTQSCAHRGLNAALAAARGDYVILCHQDVRLLADGAVDLDRRLEDLESLDPSWALAGNAGGVAPGTLALRITDPHGSNQRAGTLPARVMSLDENFIVVRRAARIGFSNDLSGFHLYGADICLHADIAGHSAYVIDFHLAHLSAGKKSAAFHEAEEQFRTKWGRALAPRWIQTTCTLLRITGDPIGNLAGRLAEGPYAKIARRLPGGRGWRH